MKRRRLAPCKAFSLFAHFDKDDKVDEYVLRYLRKIKSHLARVSGKITPRRPQRPLLARYRYALIRKRYRLKRENRRLAAA